jgi:hypothetical protein
MRTSRALVATVVVATSAVLVAGVVAGGFDWSRSSDELDAALANTRPTQVADIPAADGLPARGVFAQITSTGHFCLSDAPLDAPLTGGGGCNAADDPLGGSVISASLAYDGGPAIEAVRDARLIGLAAATVASVRIVMTDGSSRAVKLRTSTVGERGLRVFGFRVRRSDLKKGIGPTAVVAFDESGAEIGRQTTGIG